MIVAKFNVVYQKLVVKLDFRDYALVSTEMRTRIDELHPIIEFIVTADAARNRLSGNDADRMSLAFTARDLVYQGHLSVAAREAEFLADVVEGRKPLSSLGFPEMQYSKLDE